MKDLETEILQAYEKAMAGNAPDFDILNNIEYEKIEIEELQLDLPELEFEELPTATMLYKLKADLKPK